MKETQGPLTRRQAKLLSDSPEEPQSRTKSGKAPAEKDPLDNSVWDIDKVLVRQDRRVKRPNPLLTYSRKRFKMEGPVLPKYLTDCPPSLESAHASSKLPSPASSHSPSTASPQTPTVTTSTTENTSIPASVPTASRKSTSTTSSTASRPTAKEKGKGRAIPSKREQPVKVPSSPPPPVRHSAQKTRAKRSLSLSRTKMAAREESEDDGGKQLRQTRGSPKIDEDDDDDDDTALVRDESPPAFLMEDPLLAPRPDTRERIHDEFDFEGFTLSPIRPAGGDVRSFPALSRLGSGSGIFASTPSNQTSRTKSALPDDDGGFTEGGLASSTPIASQASQEPHQELHEDSHGSAPHGLITFDLSQTQLRQTVEDYLRSITDEEVRRVRSHGEARIQEIESMVESVRHNITQGST